MQPVGSADSGQHDDVLLAGHRIAHRRRHHADLGLAPPQSASIHRVVGGEDPASRSLEDEIAGGREQPARHLGVVVDAPGGLLRHRVPGRDVARRAGLHGVHVALETAGHGAPVLRRVEAVVQGLEVRVGMERIDEGRGRDVDEARPRAERHGVPVVRARDARGDERRMLRPLRLGSLDGTSGREIDVGRPGGDGVLVGREQLAGRPVEHVEEAVLRRLQQHLARAAADLEVGQDHVLGGGVVPGFARASSGSTRPCGPSRASRRGSRRGRGCRRRPGFASPGRTPSCFPRRRRAGRARGRRPWNPRRFRRDPAPTGRPRARWRRPSRARGARTGRPCWRAPCRSARAARPWPRRRR